MTRRTVTTLISMLALALPAMASFTGTDVFLPSVGRGAGSGTSQWYTCVWVHNPNATSANVQFRLLLRDRTNPAAEIFNDTIPAGDTKRYDNAVETMFGEAAFGALRVTSSQKLLVNGRIYSDPDRAGSDIGLHSMDRVWIDLDDDNNSTGEFFKIRSGADADRIPVEVDKPEPDRGRYLHPEAFGRPAELTISSPINEPSIELAPPATEDQH